jgi:hypothetical protein
MPIQTDLSVSPYFDDYNESKDFYKILFKPSVAVQVRELNQLQTILQSQIEKFGDSIFKRGTIIDGCNFTFIDSLKYAKIKDSQIDGAPVNVQTFKNLVARDSDGLTAYIIETDSGFESQDPDLNTIYLRYTNSGASFGKNAFEKNSILTIYDQNYPITKALVLEGSTGFSNNDTLVIYPAVAVQNSTGGAFFAPNTWVLNSKIIQATTGAEAEILDVDTSSNSEVTILKIRPLETDLDDSIPDANNWTMFGGYNIIGGNLGATTANASANGLIVATVGSGAVGALITDTTGKISQVAITAGGEGYYVAPHITVASTTGSIEAANIEGYNYLAKVTIQNSDSGIGNSYAVAVSEGIIYQKGHFAKVSPQLKVVEKYIDTGLPDEKVVGFDTLESIIDSNEDETLLDNAIGTYNYTAPGADRVKLTPTLIALDKGDAEANTEFLPLIEFSKGRPFKQLRNTQYSKLGVELAQRTYEESGNYVIDRFQSTTVSPDEDENLKFDVVIDPGVAYIFGNRVESVLEYTETLDKGVATSNINNVSVDLNYGNFIKITDVGGYFQFNTGEVVSLRSAVADYTANTELVGTQPAVAGSELGKARMRSMIYESGEPGSSAVYRLYLFDIEMNSGRNFADVKSVYYDGTTYKGYGDVVLENSKAVLYETSTNQLIFRTGYKAVKNATPVSYNYRSVNATATANVSGVVNSSLTTGTWKYSGELTVSEKSEIIVVPLANLETANVSTISVGAGVTSNTVVVLSNATFGSALQIGDYIKVYGTSNKIRRIVGSTNATHKTVDSGFGLTNATSNVAFICPRYVPIQLSTRSDRTANVSGSYIRIYINPPANFTAGGTVAVTYNGQRSSVSPTSKSTFRNRFVKLNLANNAATTDGPWFLGVPDIFRLKKVYIADSASVNTNSTDVTNDFFIDHNQTENVYYGGYLYRKPDSSLQLASGNHLLVQYDAFNKTGGVYTATSYFRDDAANLATLEASSNNVHTIEIPEMYTSKGEYFDLIDSIDFRISANTVANTAVVTDSDSNMTVNPAVAAYADRIDDTTEKFFPVPQGDITFNVQRYLGRTDRIIVNSSGEFTTLKGENGKNVAPAEPADALTINILTIPPYPSIPKNKSADTIELLDTNIANIKYTTKRQNDYMIKENIDQNNIIYEQPLAYKMTDIASIDRRLKNIEYRIDLKEIEDTVKNKSIPSSITSTIDRFKFGFFVDNFTSTAYSDTADPEYAAMNFDYRVTSRKTQINVKHKFYTANVTTSDSVSGELLTLPYEEYSVIKQLNSTAKVNEAIVRTSQTTAIYEFETNKRLVVRKKNGTFEPDVNLVMSATAGPAVLYMFPSGADRWEVHQSTSPGFTPSASTLVVSSESSVNMTADEKNRLKSVKALGGRWSRLPNIGFRSLSGNPKYWITGAGKITWTHNPSRGLYYTIVVQKGTPWLSWRLEYPVDSLTNLLQTSSNLAKSKYVGKFNLISPTTLNVVGKLHGELGQSGYISVGSSKITSDKDGNVKFSRVSKDQLLKVSDATAGPCKIAIQISGLRPFTKHNLYINNVLSNSKVMAKSGPFSGLFGTNTTSTSSVTTDINGTLKAEIYYDNGFPDVLTETTFSQLQALIKGVNATRLIRFVSEDSLSYAQYKMRIITNIKV